MPKIKLKDGKEVEVTEVQFQKLFKAYLSGTKDPQVQAKLDKIAVFIHDEIKTDRPQRHAYPSGQAYAMAIASWIKQKNELVKAKSRG